MQAAPAAGCEACRLTGTATFSGASLYLAVQLLQVERAARLHRATLGAMSLGCAVAAVMRWRAA